MNESGKCRNLVVSGILEDGKTPAIGAVKDLLVKMKIQLEGEAFSAERLGPPRIIPENGATETGWFGQRQPATLVQNRNVRPRPILIKFNNNWDRRKVYLGRLGLRHVENARGIFINEDLTKQMSELFYNARQAKKNGLIRQCWTEGGILSVRKLNGFVKVITDVSELRAHTLRNPNFTEATLSSSTEVISSTNTQENTNANNNCTRGCCTGCGSEV